MVAMQIEYPYPELPDHLSQLSPIQKAMSQHFGIAMGWLRENISGHSCPAHPETTDEELYDVLWIVCVPCQVWTRFIVSAEDLERWKGGVPVIEDGQYQRAEFTRPCRHLEQFGIFREGLKDGREYEEFLLEAFHERAGAIK